MIFVGFRFVQIWIFLYSFSPTCLVAEKISIRQKKILGHIMGPEVPWPNGARGARQGGSGPRKKKIHLLIGPGSGMKKIRSEPDPLSFLLFIK